MRPFANLSSLALLLFPVLGLALACEPMGAPVAPSAAAPDAPHAPDMQVITAEQAADAELRAVPMGLKVTEDADGTQMLDAWLEAARARGASRVSDVILFVVRAGGAEGNVECRTAFYPADAVEPHYVPASTRLVSVSRPVQRPVTRYRQNCHMVSKPVMRSETTYTTQYDSFSHTSRSVPQTRMVTHYEMQNECRSEPYTQMETRWEYGFEQRYEPPRVDYLATKRLREASPVCYAAPEGATSRVEGKIYPTE